MSGEHGAAASSQVGGVWSATCACGWRSTASASKVQVATEWADHVAAARAVEA